MVDFTLTDENKLVREAVRDFAEAEILPFIREWDEKGEVHREVFARMGDLGFLGAPIPEAYGGAGMDYLSFAILCEELERADTSFRVVQSVHVGLNSLALLQWGTEEQRQRWLVPQARGEKLATFGLTEPGVGTDAGNLQTTARRDGDVYRPWSIALIAIRNPSPSSPIRFSTGTGTSSMLMSPVFPARMPSLPWSVPVDKPAIPRSSMNAVTPLWAFVRSTVANTRKWSAMSASEIQIFWPFSR